jgi:hypothetical protein
VQVHLRDEGGAAHGVLAQEIGLGVGVEEDLLGFARQ